MLGARARDGLFIGSSPHSVIGQTGPLQPRGTATSRSPFAIWADWCHRGTMRRMNLRDVPDDVYMALADAAVASRQSLSAYVVDRLAEAAQAARIGGYLNTYQPPSGTGVTLEDAAAAVREVREAS